MSRDVEFVFCIVMAVATGIAMVGFVLNGKWIEMAVAGLAFVVSIVVAFQIAMSALLDGGH